MLLWGHLLEIVYVVVFCWWVRTRKDYDDDNHDGTDDDANSLSSLQHAKDCGQATICLANIKTMAAMMTATTTIKMTTTKKIRLQAFTVHKSVARDGKLIINPKESK